MIMPSPTKWPPIIVYIIEYPWPDYDIDNDSSVQYFFCDLYTKIVDNYISTSPEVNTKHSMYLSDCAKIKMEIHYKIVHFVSSYASCAYSKTF